MSPSPRKKRKATVGHISVPDLPGYWPARDGNLPRAVGADTEGVGGPTARNRGRGYIDTERGRYPVRPVYWRPNDRCSKSGHDQLDCECEDPFTCI